MSTLQQRDPDVSVIVPVYNLERFILPLLVSLKEQRLGRFTAEYIFVLNNCTDKSEQIIRSSGLPCKILTCTEQGCGPARNVGLREARGEYIWFMDGDDWLVSTEAIKAVLSRAKRDNLNILRIPFVSNSFNMNYFSMVWQYLIKRSFLKGFVFPSYQPAEDDYFMALVLHKAGYDQHTYLGMPRMDRAYYYYNYLREGSNMQRHFSGEAI